MNKDFCMGKLFERELLYYNYIVTIFQEKKKLKFK